MSAHRYPARRRAQRPKTEKQQELVQAVLQLPTNLRDLFLLHRIAGRSYEQISEQLGVGRDAVESRLAEALVRIMRVAPSAGH